MFGNMIIFYLSFVLCCMSMTVGTLETTTDAAQSYKGQFCTDPRTMRKHVAYTEWADAYSCSRHRCQPGGRNLAIYTVGCKRVEAPESAIECEEVVEDTNMQFPYCCTRLRCLVVVRGEVWTRVLGQPWETLPAAPWSHMYKMKKPPPTDTTFLPKVEEGPVYELQLPEASDGEKALRSSSISKKDEEFSDPARSAPGSPNIVIAVSTGNEKPQSWKNKEAPRDKRARMENNNNNILEESDPESRPEEEEEVVVEKKKKPAVAWTEPPPSPPSQWNDAQELSNPKVDIDDMDNMWSDHERDLLEADQAELRTDSPVQTWEQQTVRQVEFESIREEPRRSEETKLRKSGNLQSLVDAIGTRMKDIESVVARMTEKVNQERKTGEAPVSDQTIPKYNPNSDRSYHQQQKEQPKRPNAENDNYKRFSIQGSSRYVRARETTTDIPLYIEDNHMNGYFSDASNTLLRRNMPKEPASALTYMAPIGNSHLKLRSEPTETDKKRFKKRLHKKRRSKKHHKKHHAKEEKAKKSSIELERTNAVSSEDSGVASAVTA